MSTVSNSVSPSQGYDSKYSGCGGGHGANGYPPGSDNCPPGYGSMSAMRYPGYSDNIVAAAKSEYSGQIYFHDFVVNHSIYFIKISNNLFITGLYDQSLYNGAPHPHSLPEFHSRMQQTFGFGSNPAGLDPAAAAAQYMAAGAGYDMYKGKFHQ